MDRFKHTFLLRERRSSYNFIAEVHEHIVEDFINEVDKTLRLEKSNVWTIKIDRSSNIELWTDVIRFTFCTNDDQLLTYVMLKWES